MMRKAGYLALLLAALLAAGCERGNDDRDGPGLADPGEEQSRPDASDDEQAGAVEFETGPVLEKFAGLPARASTLAVTDTGRVLVGLAGADAPAPRLFELRGNGRQRPYPDQSWHEENPRLHDVRAVHTDAVGGVWVLDGGLRPDSGLAAEGVKLVHIDLENDRVMETITLDTAFGQAASRPTDFGVDAELGVVYLVDAGRPSLVIFDVYTGEVRRLLEDDPALINGNEDAASRHIHAALSPDLRYLYWQVEGSEDIYRLETEPMRFMEMPPGELAELVEVFGDARAGRAMAMDNEGQLHVAAAGEDGEEIVRFTHFGVASGLIQDPRLRGISAMAVAPNGEVLAAAGTGEEDDVEGFSVLRISDGER